MESVRTFIAVEPDPPVLSWLEACLEALRSRYRGIRWVSRENLHITLKFLGAVPADRLEEISEISAQAARATAPFRLEIGPPGSFGPSRSPQVFWLGILPGLGLEGLVDLQKRLETALEAAGFPREERPFKPHFTLGRNQRRIPAEGWDRGLPERPSPGNLGFECRSVTTFSSELTPKGPIHRVISQAPLCAGGQDPTNRDGAEPRP